MIRHLKASARKKCTVKWSAGNPERKRIRNRVPRRSANNVARTPSCVGPWESFKLSCARFASLRPSFIVLSFRRLLLFSNARSSSFPPIAAIKERKRSQKERRTKRSGLKEREREREIDSSPLLHGPLHARSLASTLLRRSPGLDHPAVDSLTVLYATPLCLKETGPSFLSPLLLSYPLDHSAHPAHPNDSYLFVQRVRTGVFQPTSQRRRRGYRNLREGFDSARLHRWTEGPTRKRDPDRSRRKWKSRLTVLYKVNRRENDFLAQLYYSEQPIYKVFSKLSAVGRGFFS